MRERIDMVTIKLSKKQAKTLRRVLVSDRNEYVASLHATVKDIDNGVAAMCDEHRSRRHQTENLMKHTTRAVQVLDAVIEQVEE